MGGGKECSVCQATKPESAFSKKQWSAKAHSRKCTSCVDKASQQPRAPAQAAEQGIRPDVLTLEELAVHLATARAQYHKNTDLPDEVICRMMLSTRMSNLPLARCRIAPSLLPGAGSGLFATRNISEGELISLYPCDAILIWEDSDHSADSTVQIFFGKHVPAAERDVTRAVTEWRGYEVPCHERMSIVADPRRSDDSAYLAHFANDVASCASADEQEEYERVSAAGANAMIIPLDVEELDSKGNGQVLHFAQRAIREIKAGQEIFVSYGAGYWELSASGMFELPSSAATT